MQSQRVAVEEVSGGVVYLLATYRIRLDTGGILVCDMVPGTVSVVSAQAAAKSARRNYLTR